MSDIRLQNDFEIKYKAASSWEQFNDDRVSGNVRQLTCTDTRFKKHTFNHDKQFIELGNGTKDLSW